MRKLLLLFFFLGALSARSQDTLTVMQYNLLNYGNYTSYCTQSNNNESLKNGYIATIVHYVNPDILTVNEMAANAQTQTNLLDSALNTNGITKYSETPFFKQNQYSYLMSGLYYNHKKLGFSSVVNAQSEVRDINVYKLYYLSPNLERGDTIFIYCLVAHLKAGNSSDDANTRNIMATNTMNYLTHHNPDENYMIMGDFNLYTSSEAAYQTLTTNATIHFNDPINKPGNWHNNSQFAQYDTQSTHGSRTNSCASSGGMDDRFDFILISDNIKNNANKVQYISGSYQTIGQDGLHFNTSINAPPENTSAPANVIAALYNNSDHLPVTLKLKVDVTTGIDLWEESSFDKIKYNNPATNNLNFNVQVKKSSTLDVTIYSLLGQKELYQEYPLHRGWQQFSMNISKLPRGLYLIRFTDRKTNFQYSQKFIKN